MQYYLVYNSKTGQIWRCLNQAIILPDKSIYGGVEGINNMLYPANISPQILRISQATYERINNNYNEYLIQKGTLVKKTQ